MKSIIQSKEVKFVGGTFAVLVVVFAISYLVSNFTPYGKAEAAESQAKLDAQIEEHLASGEHHLLKSIQSVNTDETEATFVDSNGEIVSAKISHEEKFNRILFDRLYTGEFKDIPKMNAFTTVNYFLIVEDGCIIIKGYDEEGKLMKTTPYTTEQSISYLTYDYDIVICLNKDGEIDHIDTAKKMSSALVFNTLLEKLKGQ